MTRRRVLREDLLVSAEARATWKLLTDVEREALVVWVNKAWFDRGRRARRKDAIRALELGGAGSGLTNAGVLESILVSVPWGTP